MNRCRRHSNDTDWSRRDFLRIGALASGAVTTGAVRGQVNSRAEDINTSASDTLKIKIAGYRYDRVDALIDGRASVDGCDVKFRVSSIGAMNTHVFSGPQTFDVSEIGLSPYMLAFANEGFRDYILIPVFPLRLFRHRSIFIRTDRGIEKPQDLRGRTVATPGYSSTSLTWIRGIMQHEYGVEPNQIKWIISSKDSSAKASGGPSAQENVRPTGLSIGTGPPGKDESDLLVDGDVDALFHAAEPKAFVEGHPKVGRLFADYRKTEQAYYAKTGIFPIMHAVAIRAKTIKENPWLPKAVFNAYARAKQYTYAYMEQAAWFKDSLPWFGPELDETRRLMGDNFYSYGIGPNRGALEALFQYSHEQGLAGRKLTVEELFDPSTLALKEETA